VVEIFLEAIFLRQREPSRPRKKWLGSYLGFSLGKY